MKKVYIIVLGAIVLVIVLVLVFLPKQEQDSNRIITSKTSFLEKAESSLENGNLLEAKELYKKEIENNNDPKVLKYIQEKIEKINLNILFSSVIDDCSINYVVKPNDTLGKIASKYGTTVNLIKRSNGLSSDIIRLDQKLKVHTCKFSIVIDKSQNLLFLKRNGEVVKTYTVSTGKDNNTPVGKFKIINKIVKPTWFRTGAVIPPDSPDNVLGSRWMGFDIKGYGIHGTVEPENLGKQITLGCVRMLNEEVEELYDLIPSKTEVVIVD